MAVTQNTYTGNGSTTIYSLSFSYLDKADVKVTVNNVLVTNYIFATASSIQFSTPPSAGAAIRIYRDTDTDQTKATFFAGSAIKAKDLNSNFTQTLYAVQEIAFSALSKIGDTMQGILNMGGFRITNLGTPAADADGATKKYVDDRYGDLEIPGVTRWRKTATAGQTTFSGGGDYGGTLAYSASRETVYVNGALQQRNVDYTADNGTSIVFTPALVLGDVVDVHCVNNAAGITTDQASGVYWTQSGTGAVTRTVDAKLKDVVSVKDFGAVGNGVADDTAAIQAAIDALPAGGQLSGVSGSTYIVTSLLLKSNMTLRDINLKTKTGSTDFVAPVTIDGRTTAKANITLVNVNIDGNRQNQTLILSPSEDGGRHGFRVLGNVSKLSLIRCSANYCAGDGIEIFSAEAKPATDNYDTLCVQDVLVDSCTFNWNRRHGITGDSINRGRFHNITAQHNGKDLNTSDPLTHGNRGARFGGNLYGRAFDFEGYGVGTAIHDIEIMGGFFTKNIAGGLIYDGVNPAASGFVPRKNIRISDAHFDVSTPGSEFSFLVFAPTATSTTAVYEDVSVTNCKFDSSIQITGVKGFSCHGGSVVSDWSAGYYARVDLCSDYSFVIRATKQEIFVTTLPVVATQSQLIGSITITTEATALVGFTPNGYLIRHLYTGVAASVGTGYYRTYTAPAGFKIRCYSASFVESSSTRTQPFSCGNGTNATVMGLSFDIVSSGDKNFEVIYELMKA
jgi:hypothetical protein